MPGFSLSYSTLTVLVNTLLCIGTIRHSNDKRNNPITERNKRNVNARCISIFELDNEYVDT